MIGHDTKTAPPDDPTALDAALERAAEGIASSGLPPGVQLVAGCDEAGVLNVHGILKDPDLSPAEKLDTPARWSRRVRVEPDAPLDPQEAAELLAAFADSLRDRLPPDTVLEVGSAMRECGRTVALVTTGAVGNGPLRAGGELAGRAFAGPALSPDEALAERAAIGRARVAELGIRSA